MTVREIVDVAYLPDPWSEAVPAWTNDANVQASRRRANQDTAAPTLRAEIAYPDAARAGDDRPVIVYIHGGRYEGGSFTESYTGGDALIADHGLIQVRISYRKQLEGFIPFNDEAPHHYRGIDDCNLALEWVQRHIESYGGDPTNVTLMGQSAGAGIALWLARKDHYRGGFRRVVAISPGYPRRGLSHRARWLRVFLRSPLTRRHLSGMSGDRLNRGYQQFRSRYITDMALGPYPFDGRELVDLPMVVSVTDREFHDHPAACWFDRRPTGSAHLPAGDRRPRSRLTRRVATTALGADPGQLHLWEECPHPAGEILSDSLIRRWAAQALEEHRGPHWLIEYAGLEHCADLPLIFGTPPNAPSPPDGLSSAGMSEVIAAFARGTQPSWPQYSPTTGRAALRVLAGEPPVVTHDPLRRSRSGFRFPSSPDVASTSPSHLGYKP